MFWMLSVEDTLLTKFDFYLRSMIVSSVPLHKDWKIAEFNSFSLLKMQRLPCTEGPHEPFINSYKHEIHPVRLILSAESTNHSTMFFSHNKSTNSTFSHGFSAKRLTIFCVSCIDAIDIGPS
jgi:hypothetical protein